MARSPSKSQRRSKGWLGRSRVANGMSRPPHVRHGCYEVLTMFKTVTQRSPRSLVTQSSSKNAYHCKRCVSFCVSASPVPPLCLLWMTNGVHWEITVVIIAPLFSDHHNTWATMAMVLPPFCFLCTTCCATTVVLVVQGRLLQLYKGTTFFSLDDHWASCYFFLVTHGGVKVAALYKGRFACLDLNTWYRLRYSIFTMSIYLPIYSCVLEVMMVPLFYWLIITQTQKYMG